MDVSPAKPSFEDMWEARTVVNIYAPKGTTAELRVQLAMGERRHPQTFTRKLALPCDEEQWTQYVRSIKRNKPYRNALDAANKCSIEIDCEPLGHGELTLTRQPSPIRWVSREQNSGCLLRLEELDKQAGVSCFTYSFSRPMEAVPFVDDPRTEFRATGANLYLAETTTQVHASVIAAAPIRSLLALREDPYIPALSSSEESVRKLLAAYHLWRSARIVGDASAFDRREIVLTGIYKELMRLLCGNSWVQMEHTYQGRPHALALKQSISTKPAHLSVIGLIAEANLITSEQAVETAVDSISQLSLSHNLIEGAHDARFSHALVDFAYRLLNRPESLKPEDSPGERIIIENLLRNPVLCRLARFSYLVANAGEESSTAMVETR
jgi:hypothetical protein